MNCFGKIFNLTIFVCNFLFFLTGCGILGLGAYMQTNIKTFGDFMVDYDVNSAVILMTLGGIVLGLAFLGCCGACTENPCLMFTYATAIAIILICEIGAAVTMMVFKDDVARVLQDGLIKGLDGYGIESNVTDAYTATTKSWDELQTNMKCCGVTEYTDWENSPQLKSNNSVPDSCCKEITEGCGTGELDKVQEVNGNIYTSGCLDKIFDVIKDNIFYVAIAAACIVAVQCIIVCVACCLGNSMKKAQYEQK